MLTNAEPQFCRCCGKPLHQLHYPEQTMIFKSGLVKTFPARTQVECHNQECPMWMQTLSALEYLTMDLTEYLCNGVQS
jgi:hypothetical protein